MSIAPVVQRYRLGQEPKPAVFWREREPVERVSAVEEARREVHGMDYAATSEFPRVLKILKRSPD